MKLGKEKLNNFLKKIDKRIMFISTITSLMILYFMNPLTNVELTEWNRTFSTSILAGISIEKRIHNFYLLFFLQIPIVFMIITFLYGKLFQYREKYKKIFLNLSIILAFPILFLYISRYTSDDTVINMNVLIQTMLAFFGVLAITACLDKQENFCQEHIFVLCAAYLVGVVTLNILLRLHNQLLAIGIMSGLFLIYIVFTLKTKLGKKYFSLSYNYICFLIWIPTYILLTREFFFILNEKGITIMKYYTNICGVVAFYLLFAFILVFLLRNKKVSFTIFACVGIIVSLAFTRYFSKDYQYVFNYGNYSILYELGNVSVAADTMLYGKLPIIDYFSAHALSDVLTQILYALIHSTEKAMVINPYRELTSLAGLLILFFILKEFFGKDRALLMVCLFPFSIYGLKINSICFIAIVALLYILKKNSIKSNIIFWFTILFTALFRYDEGISLGIACILAVLLINAIQKNWKNIKRFLITGASIGILVVVFYFVYCLFTGVPAITRMKEWMSVSLGSNTTWATEIFGNATTFEFLLCYYIIPVVALAILVIVTIKYMVKKEDKNIIGVIIAFSIAQLMHIGRAIVFHNLAEARAGNTDVLLNFVHWTVSFFVLYELKLKNISEEKKIFIWSSTFGCIVVFQCIFIKGIYPVNVTLYEGAAICSETVNLSNDMTRIWEKERVVYDEPTTKFVNQFKQVFDALLDDEETFLDFSNISCLYLLTNRQRPCYISQIPSTLTDLYSQECFLEEISEYNIPLAVIGAKQEDHIQSMMGVPHNIRYYKIAEYIYENYRPLVLTGDFAIWCENEYYEEFKEILQEKEFLKDGYILVDYGYDATKSQMGADGNIEYYYHPYHQYSLKRIPYLWANYDEYHAIKNDVIVELSTDTANQYKFEGSKQISHENGNYMLFEATNSGEEEKYINVTFQDSNEPGARFEYSVVLLPGNNQYMIRVSQDYFWHAFNIDDICFWSSDEFMINNVKILEGD